MKNIVEPTVKIAGNPATVTDAGDSDAKTWLASYEIQQGDSEGLVPFTLDFVDLAGNAAIQVTAVTTGTAAVTVDKTAPVVTGIQDGALVNNDVTITFTEGTATLNNNPYTKGTAVTNEGTYTLIVTDDAGNKTTITFTIDKTAPTILINGVAPNNSYARVTPTITTNDSQATITTTLERNGTQVPFTIGSVISQAGSYTLTVKATDAAGNETTETVSFTIYTPSYTPSSPSTPPSRKSTLK